LQPSRDVDIRSRMKTKTLLQGLVFGEGPRWHDGKLWFSDMHARWVMTVDPSGRTEKIVEVPNLPSGLGWLPDGRLILVSMRDRQLLRLEGEKLVTHADLSKLASFDCNDMVVDRLGRAYVGNFGYDLHANAPRKPAELVLATPDGKARVVARDLEFPNGTVITPDGKTLVVGESFGAKLTAFDVESDGSLTRRRVWAAVENMVPDGICLDAEGAIWVASPLSEEVLRVCEGGAVTHRFKPSLRPYACMLGGADRRTLFLVTSETHDPTEALAKRSGRIETVEVEVPGAGLP
jgi:sugar lactone lactonase YvrE